MLSILGHVNKGYRRLPVASDGDCGYTAFGITRTEAHQLLIDNSDLIQGHLVLPIHDALLTEAFPRYLFEKNVMSAEDYQAMINGDEVDSDRHRPEIQKAYIDYDVRDGHIDAGWAHPSILQALAQIQSVELHLWRLGENDVLIPHQVGDENYAAYVPVGASSRTDLLFMGGNHFERLAFEGYDQGIPDHGISPLLVSSSSRSSATIPEGWSWISDIMGEAHLPTLGLPVRWETTKKKNMRLAFDPATNTTLDIDSGRSKKRKSSPVDFIKSTPGKTPMPGTDTPASARLTRYLEPCFNQHFVTGPRGETLVPCIAHGDYVDVESLQTDHAQAKEDIQQRQQALVAHLNSDATFADVVMQLEGMDKFFVKVEGEYYGTVFFYDLYFNDIDNLWLICGACNLQKSNQESVAWFKDQWLYGDEFINYVGRLKDPIILAKTENKQGLGEVAIQWYWDRHANYASIAKKLMQDVVTPIQLLNQCVDRVVGLVRAGADERRLQRHLASIDFRMALLEAVSTMKGIDMPPRDSESSHSSSDPENYLRDEDGCIIPVTEEDYAQGAKAYVDNLKQNFQQDFSEHILKAQKHSVTRLNPGGH